MRVIPRLVESHRVVAPDLPGHGATQMPRERIDAPSMLAWLGELIESTCSSPPTIVGQIAGGAMAARFAIEHGDRVGRLVLVDMLGLAPFQPAPQFAAALNDFMTRPNADTHDGLWRQCAFDLDAMRDAMGDRWEQMKTYNLDLASGPTLLAAEHALIGEFGMAPIPAEELAKIAVPVTLIWGRHDRATPLSVATDASARHGWPLRIIENAGDDPAMEQPEAFVRVLREVLGGS
jgi:pimeloyl-ACP methyl ester carboxylesterase